MTSRKKIFIVSAALAVVALIGGLLWWHFSGPRTVVIFIPGWNTEHTRPELYEERLKWIYPDAKIKTFFWKSNGRWGAAKKNATECVPKILADIAKKSPEDQAEIIVVAHSLGGRIAVGIAENLAKKKIRIKQFILLGAALNFDTDASVLSEASTGTNINVFCLKDDTLRLSYSNTEKKLAAGFCGFQRPPAERFQQYSIHEQHSDNQKNLDFISHESSTYLGELKRIVTGKTAPYYPKYDYSEVDLGMLPVPSNWFIPAELVENMEILDQYAGWKLAKVKNGLTIYLIVDHHNCIVQYSAIPNVGFGLPFPIKKRFDKIKKQIRELPRPDERKPVESAAK